MKIAFDHQIFSFQKYGGISRYYKELAEHLILLDQEIKFFAPIHINKYLKDLPKDIVSGKYLNNFIPGTGRLFIEPINNYIEKTLLINWKPTIIHETYYSLNSPNVICPRIITVYDMIHEKFNNKNESFINRKLVAMQRANHIICISESTKKDLLEYYPFLNDKVSVVHLGYTNFKKIKELPIDISLNKPFLLFVGARNGYKNFKNFIIAFSKSSQLVKDFNIIAFGGENFNKDEINLFKTLRLKENQLFHIKGNDSILKTLYKNATALIYPSLYEGFGLPIIEAMSENCSVITSNTSSMPEIIGDAGLLFDPNQIESIMNTMETLIYSNSLKKSLIFNGKARIANFTWEKCASKTLNIYNKFNIN
jgi:glycosyltransferase involved in cell wall biosynthesis